MSQKLLIGGFKWVENTSQFSKDFIDNFNEDNDEGYFLEVDIQYPEKLHSPNNDLPFLLERMKIEKFKNLLATCMIRKNISFP